MQRGMAFWSLEMPPKLPRTGLFCRPPADSPLQRAPDSSVAGAFFEKVFVPGPGQVVRVRHAPVAMAMGPGFGGFQRPPLEVLARAAMAAQPDQRCAPRSSAWAPPRSPPPRGRGGQSAVARFPAPGRPAWALGAAVAPDHAQAGTVVLQALEVVPLRCCGVTHPAGVSTTRSWAACRPMHAPGFRRFDWRGGRHWAGSRPRRRGPRKLPDVVYIPQRKSNHNKTTAGRHP